MSECWPRQDARSAQRGDACICPLQRAIGALGRLLLQVSELICLYLGGSPGWNGQGFPTCCGFEDCY